MPRRVVVLFIAVILLAGCNGETALRRFTPTDADARARGYVALLTRGQPDSAALRLAPTLAGPRSREALIAITALLKGQRFDSTRVIGVQVHTINGIRHVNLSYELHSPTSGWSVTNVATLDSANTWFVEGVSGRAIPHPLEDDVRFTLAGKSARHYLWLLISIVCVAISVGTATFVATRRGMPKRWGWAFASLVGLGTFGINWNTGVSGTNLYSVLFGGASLVRGGPVTPWILSFSIPIGAYYAWRRYRRWQSPPAVVIESEGGHPHTDVVNDSPDGLP